MGTAEKAVEPRPYLTFNIDGEEYAIDLPRTREIVEFDTLTRVPKTVAAIRGVMNLRGAVLPVIDLSLQFGGEERPVTRRTCVIVVEVDLEGEKTVMGLLVDSVGKVVELSPEEIVAPPSFGTRVRVDYLKAMGKNGKRFILLLDVDRVLSIDELHAVASLQGDSTEESPEKRA